jgi:transcriptional regulator NrdR family protein
MRCPKCDQLPTSVLKTERPVEEGLDNVKRRRRVCRNCRHYFHTYEVHEPEYQRMNPHIDLSQKRSKPHRSPLKTKNKKDKA